MKKISMKQGILFFYAFDAVLLIFLIFAFLPFSKKNRSRMQETALLNPNRVQDLVSITIARQDDAVFLSRAGAYWWGTALASRKQYRWPADMQSVAKLLDAAQKITPVSVSAENAKSWQNFGVDKEHAVSVTFYGEKDSILSQLFFGRDDNLSNRIAFRTWTDDTVYEVDDGIASYLSVDESFWADPFLVPLCLGGEESSRLRRGSIQNIAPREGLPVNFVVRRDLPNGAAVDFAIYKRELDYIVIPSFRAGPAASAEESAFLEKLNYRYSISTLTFERLSLAEES